MVKTASRPRRAKPPRRVRPRKRRNPRARPKALRLPLKLLKTPARPEWWNPPASRTRRTKPDMARRRHVPQRTCIGCRSARDKRELLRIVRTPDGEIAFDPTGKRSGRGAYVCRDEACLDRALVARALDRKSTRLNSSHVKISYAVFCL